MITNLKLDKANIWLLDVSCLFGFSSFEEFFVSKSCHDLPDIAKDAQSYVITGQCVWKHNSLSHSMNILVR